MTHHDFLQTIMAAPNHAMARLAYADWLEERADFRAAFFRNLTPFSQRYRYIGHLWMDGPFEGWEATDLLRQRTVALHLGGASGFRNYCEPWKQTEVAARLGNKGMVPVEDVGVTEQGWFFVAHPMFEVASLSDILEPPRLAPHKPKPPAPTLPRLVEFLIVVAHTLELAHSHGIIHGSLTPREILIDLQTQAVWIEDRGQVWIDGVSSPESLIDGPWSPGYLCIDQLNGNRSPPVLVHNLGSILYWILYGSAPNSTPGEVRFNSRSAVLAAQLPKKRRAPRPLLLSHARGHRRRMREAFRALERICLKALELDARKRQQRPNDLADELQAWLNQYRDHFRNDVQASTEPSG